MINNKEYFIGIIPKETSNNIRLTKEERIKELTKLIDNINTDAECAGDSEISGMSVMLNINIILYIKEDLNYKYYYKFEGSDLPNENINILFINNNHFDLLIKNNIKNNLEIISENDIFNNSYIPTEENKKITKQFFV